MLVLPFELFNFVDFDGPGEDVIVDELLFLDLLLIVSVSLGIIFLSCFFE